MAHVIKDELSKLAKDFARFDERMKKLASHIEQANKDVSEVRISSDKISRRFQQEKSDVVHDAMISFGLDAHVMGTLTEGLQGHAAEQGVEERVRFFPDGLGDALPFKRALRLAAAFFWRGSGAIDQQHILFGGIQDVKNRDFIRFA
jgi:hypothetical protein